MMKNDLLSMLNFICLACVLSFTPVFSTYADEEPSSVVKSVHYGFVSSTGADFVGLETKSPIVGGLYSFYSIGLMSGVTGGLSYHSNYQHNGLVLTAGVGLIAIAYSSVSYKWRLDKHRFFELGVGRGFFFEGGEGCYPVISYEERM